MDRHKPSIVGLCLLLVAIIAMLGGVELAKGGFYLGKHEGDTVHLAELVLRMARGEVPHRDFMTPLGILAIAPMAFFVALGQGLGHAIFWSQILVALTLLPAVVWVGHSRLTGAAIPRLYGAFVIALCLALVHGEANVAVSISMHYNRWAWAIVYLMVPIVMIAPDRERPVPDGLVLGLGAAALGLIKVTYLVALFPALLIGLVARGWWRTLGVGLVAAAGLALLATAYAGVEFWPAYLADLRTVATTEIRPNPGESIATVLSGPTWLGGNLALLAAIVLLRQAGRMTEGMILLFLMPGFLYITYQNFGNDPQWLLLLALLAFVLRPASDTRNGFGWDLRAALTYTALAAVAFGLGSALNMAFSPIRHLAMPTEKTVPLLLASGPNADVFAAGNRAYAANFALAADATDMPFAAYRPNAERKNIVDFGGRTWGNCEMTTGTKAFFEAISGDLESAGYSGKAIGAADLFSAFWLYGDFRPVRGAAPWNYGTPAGLDNADFIVVPLCPFAVQVQSMLLKGMIEDGWQLDVVRKTPLYWLVAPKAPATK